MSDSPVARFDEMVEELFDRLRGHRELDRLMYTLSALGDWSLLWHLVAATLAATGRRKEAVALAATLGIESLLVNQGVKRFFNRTRPEHDHVHPHSLRVPTTTSFPSGHASAAACAAVLLTREMPAGAPLWWTLALAVSASRIHVRVHHGTDVVGGALIGAAIGAAAAHFWPKWESPGRRHG